MRNKHRVLSSAAPACILGFKLTLLAVSLIGFQLRDTNIELEESRAKTASATTKPIAGLHSVGPQYVDRELSPADFKHLSGRGRRASHTVVPDGDEHSRQKAAILSSSEEEQEEKPSSEKNPHEHPLSWDKSWWTFGAWLLWILSCVTPTVLIFVLNGMTQGWQCGMVYLAFLVPLDVATLYFDIYAYDTGNMFALELAVAIAINCCLCACLLPATALMRLEQDEASGPAVPGPYGTFGGPQQGGNPPRPTDYGRPSEKTEYV